MADLLARLQAAVGDRYTVQHEVGRGGMARVYRALDCKHHRLVAIKVLKPEIAAALGAERFLREIEIAAPLSHPHILPLLDSGHAKGLLYFVMPYVEGESLRDRLARETQLPLDEALRIAREVADGLSYAHSHGVVHRDIKPANILLASDHAVVTDFGIARAVTAASGDQLTETGMAVGTPAYMSPEQAAGHGEIDGRSDLYSLGCVLYEMLAGQPPFAGATPQAMLARHTLDPVPPLATVRKVPAQVERALLRALEKVPADRFATPGLFAQALLAQPEAERGRVFSRTGVRRGALAASLIM
ncbi:MAG: serine/threonine-protein kinase, partial [Betaproteobacteria bacterium]